VIGSPPNTTQELERHAYHAVTALQDDPRVVAIALLGSLARGNAASGSDIDLLVLVDRTTATSELFQALPADLRHGRMALIVRAAESWLERASEGDLFVAHAVMEGKVFHDPNGLLERAREALRGGPLDTKGDIRRQLHLLRLYRDPGRLNGNHLFALAHLFGIGKAVAIARCVEWGTPTFVKETAFDRVSERRPDLASEVELIRALRPFYDVAADREVSDLPFDYHDADKQLAAAIAAIERMAHG